MCRNARRPCWRRRPSTTPAPAGSSAPTSSPPSWRPRTRVVIDSEHWTAYVPFAARWPVEVHLAPHRDVPDLPALDDDERDDLAEVYLDLLRRLDRYYVAKDGSPIRLPYIAGWHQAPSRRGSRRVAAAPAGDVGAARRPRSSSTSPARSRAWAAGSTTCRRSRSPSGCARSPRERRTLRPTCSARTFGAEPDRRVVRARPGQPDRRAHRLQRAGSACRSPCRSAPSPRCAARDDDLRADRLRPGRRRGRGGARRRRRRAPGRLGRLRRRGAVGPAQGRVCRGRARRGRGRPGAARRRACPARRPSSAPSAPRASDLHDLGLLATDDGRRAWLAAPASTPRTRIAQAPTGGMDQSAALLRRRPATPCCSTAATTAPSRCRSTSPRTGWRCW